MCQHKKHGPFGILSSTHFYVLLITSNDSFTRLDCHPISLKQFLIKVAVKIGAIMDKAIRKQNQEGNLQKNLKF